MVVVVGVGGGVAVHVEKHLYLLCEKFSIYKSDFRIFHSLMRSIRLHIERDGFRAKREPA